MEEKEPFKIKFTTVLIVVIVLFIIIGILAYNFERTNSVLREIANLNNDGNTNMGLSHTSAEPNDYNFFSENYRESIKDVLVQEDKSLSVLRSTSGTLQKSGITSIELDSLGDIYLNIEQTSPLYGKYGKITKIASDVLDFEMVDNGQYTLLYLIHFDGTVTEVGTHMSEAELSIEKTADLSGIIKVITIPTTDGSTVAFVDINGFIYNASGKAFE